MPWKWNEKSYDITGEANRENEIWLVGIIYLMLESPSFINNKS